MLYFLDVEEEAGVRRVSFSGAALSVGRGEGNDVVLDDVRASRHHCRLERTPEGIHLEDLGSSNGTIVGGQRVRLRRLEIGEVFRIGNARLRLVSESQPSEAHSAETRGSGAEASRESSANAPGPTSETRKVARRKPSARRAGTLSESAPDLSEELDRSDGLERSDDEAPLVLEGIRGPHTGRRIPVDRSPFLLGRGASCDLRIEDKRATAEHARIVRLPTGLYVEDLESTNGTFVGRRRVTRTLLTNGAVLRIGKSGFRVLVAVTRPSERGTAAVTRPSERGTAAVTRPSERGTAARARRGRESNPDDLRDGEFEIRTVDMDRWLAASGAEHPLVVLAVVALAGILGFFSVQTARGLLVQEAFDVPGTNNLLAANWSFEEPPLEDGRVPHWELESSEHGSIERTIEFAQPPGKSALRVNSWTSGLCPVFAPEPVSVQGGDTFLLEGFVANQGAFAAGFLVTWMQATRAGAIEIDRIFTDSAREAGEAIDVRQALEAPTGATEARVACFLLGEGTATFDRVVLRRLDPGKVVSTGDDPARPGIQVGTERFRPTGGDGTLTVRLDPRGVLSVSVARRTLISGLWLGLPPEQDPLALGTRLAPPRSGAPQDGAAVLLGEVPDLAGGTWRAAETSALPTRDNVVVRWRSSTAEEEGESRGDLCVYLESRSRELAVALRGGKAQETASAEATRSFEGTLGPELAKADGAFREVLVGEGSGRISLFFSRPVEVEPMVSPRHPSGYRMVLRASGVADLDVQISRGSRLEKDSAARAIRAAEVEFRAGRPGLALDALLRVVASFEGKSNAERQNAGVERAVARLKAWRQQAQTSLVDLRSELDVLRSHKAVAFYESLLGRCRALRAEYQGAAGVQAAIAAFEEELRSFWKRQREGMDEASVEATQARALLYLEENRLALAELFFRRVVQQAPEGRLAKDAQLQLKFIETRRRTEREILLIR